MIPYLHRCICRRDFQEWDRCDVGRYSQCSLHRNISGYTLLAMAVIKHVPHNFANTVFCQDFEFFGTDEPICRAETEMQTERMNLWANRGKERMGRIERVVLTYIHFHVWNRQRVGTYCISQRAQLGALWKPGGVRWGWMRRRLKKEGIYVYLWLIQVLVQQKPTQHCKAIILQFKKI